MKNEVRVTGIAIPFGMFVDPQSLCRTKFLPTAFSDLILSRVIAAPVRINHRAGSSIPRPSPLMTWKLTDVGMQVSFCIDLSVPRGRAIALAIRHGYLNGLSFAGELETVEMRDKIGRIQLVTSAIPHEISLTDRAVIDGTSVALSGWTPVKTKTLPPNPQSRDLLRDFLNRYGIDPTPTPTSTPTPTPTHTPQNPLREAARRVIERDRRLEFERAALRANRNAVHLPYGVKLIPCF